MPNSRSYGVRFSDDRDSRFFYFDDVLARRLRGHDAERSRQCVIEAGRAGERHGAAGGGGRGLSRRAEGKHARERAAPLGRDAE